VIHRRAGSRMRSVSWAPTDGGSGILLPPGLQQLAEAKLQADIEVLGVQTQFNHYELLL